MIALLVVAIIAAIVAAIIAEKKNRNQAGWALLCLFVPLAVVILVALDPLPARAVTILPTDKGMAGYDRPCPGCGAECGPKAIFCPACGARLSDTVT